MTPHQYHEVLIGLDRALFVFHEAQADMLPEDATLCAQIAILRSQVLRAESGHPFPFGRMAPAERPSADPQASRAGATPGP